MTLHLELDPETEARLAERAKADRQDINTAARILLRSTLEARTRLSPPDPEKAIAALRRMAHIAPPAGAAELNGCTWPRSLIYDDDRY
jgi:hypothetical protein